MSLKDLSEALHSWKNCGIDVCLDCLLVLWLRQRAIIIVVNGSKVGGKWWPTPQLACPHLYGVLASGQNPLLSDKTRPGAIHHNFTISLPPSSARLSFLTLRLKRVGLFKVAHISLLVHGVRKKGV